MHHNHVALTACIEVDIDLLNLRPADHPDRALSCRSLAASLWTCYKQTGDITLLDKAITLEEEALDLCPADHQDRALSCGNRAISLKARYNQI
jgi:hypothetical protein